MFHTINSKDMAILKKSDATPKRPVIITIYGQAGAGKTSLATTSNNPLLIDTDRGFDRAVNRCDTLIANKWEEIIGSVKKFFASLVSKTSLSNDPNQDISVEFDWKEAKKSRMKFRIWPKEPDLSNSFVPLNLKVTTSQYSLHTNEKSDYEPSPDCIFLSTLKPGNTLLTQSCKEGI